MERVDVLNKFGNIFNNNYDNTQIFDILLLTSARTVRRLRKTRNISQGEAALIADISQSYLSNVEHAKHLLSLHKFASLSFAMQVHPKECYDIFLDELIYSESIYRSFSDNREQYDEYSDFQEFAKDNLNNDI